MKKNLIMAMGSGYSENKLAPFFNSLNPNGYQMTVVSLPGNDLAKPNQISLRLIGYSEIHKVHLDGNIVDFKYQIIPLAI
jgi:hypothetical protein